MQNNVVEAVRRPSIRSRLARATCLLTVAILCAASTRAQCPEWTTGFAISDLRGTATSLQVFDDGTGPQLYVAGDFTQAGGISVRGMARWSGTAWSAVGTGTQVGGFVEDLVVYDDGLGGGPKLYAAGSFVSMNGVAAANIARWDGTSWTPLGSGLSAPCRTLFVFDDGSGPKLIAGGDFTMAGGNPAGHVASWDGTSWSALGIGMDGNVFAFAAFDDGSGGGVQLHAGGHFNNADGIQVWSIAKWTGSAWVGFGGGLDPNTAVKAMRVFDDGTGGGPALYVAGRFVFGGSFSGPVVFLNSIGRWDGTSWSTMAGGIGANQTVESLAVYDDGSGPHLYAAGDFFSSSTGMSLGRIMRWDVGAWSALGTGLSSWVFDLCVWDDGSGAGEALYAGGVISTAGGLTAHGIARWSGTTWSALTPPGGFLDENINSFSVFDDGNGPALYAVGAFTATDGGTANRVARFDGTTWHQVGGGLSSVAYTSAVFDDGTGPALYVGGAFLTAGGITVNRIARWDGTAWSALGSGANDIIAVLEVHDDGSGPALYAGGSFTSIGGVAANRIARWNGTAWSALGSGMGNTVLALASAAPGGVSALYAGGSFTGAGGVSVGRVAKWNGTAWSALGSGVNGGVDALEQYDDGSGPALFVGGAFTSAGGLGTSTRYFARWNGTAWSAAIGGTLGDHVLTLAVHDDGTGPSLYVGGYFSTAGGMPASHIARYGPSGWSALGSGLTGTAGSPPQGPLMLAATTFSDGPGQPASLYVGGYFNAAGGLGATNCARLRGCPPVHTTYCFGDGSGTACPCANQSLPADEGGCLNSFGTPGTLRAAGLASIQNDTLVLLGSRMTNAAALYFQGTTRVAGGQGGVFGDGLRCAGGSVRRLATKVNVGGASQFPESLDPRLSVIGAVPAGSTRTYQAWYRNSNSFCTPDVYNLTNGVEVAWSN